MFSQHFLSTLHQYALAIAWRARKEDHLQSVETLLSKYEGEKQELVEAEDKWDELPDIGYYAACLALQGHDVSEDAQALFVAHGVTLAQVERATLAKYAYRAAGNRKNIEVEHDLILAAIR